MLTNIDAIIDEIDNHTVDLSIGQYRELVDELAARQIKLDNRETELATVRGELSELQNRQPTYVTSDKVLRILAVIVGFHYDPTNYNLTYQDETVQVAQNIRRIIHNAAGHIDAIKKVREATHPTLTLGLIDAKLIVSTYLTLRGYTAQTRDDYFSGNR